MKMQSHGGLTGLTGVGTVLDRLGEIAQILATQGQLLNDCRIREERIETRLIAVQEQQGRAEELLTYTRALVQQVYSEHEPGGINRIREALGRLEAYILREAPLDECSYSVYSQGGEDGFLQRLIRLVPIKNRSFVEFGVEDYHESNTRFLLTSNRWRGLVMDSGTENIAAIQRSRDYFMHDLTAIEAFITRENINQLLRVGGMSGDIGLLSIDIDGNDYWVWEAITEATPALVSCEYNHRFGADEAVTVPYKEDFDRSQAHHSMVYFGASLAALWHLGQQKGYSLVGCSASGVNAFFVRNDLLPPSLPALTPQAAFVTGQHREARDEAGNMLGLTLAEERELLRGLPIVKVGDKTPPTVSPFLAAD